MQHNCLVSKPTTLFQQRITATAKGEDFFVWNKYIGFYNERGMCLLCGMN
jgi:hypothetical protein